MALAQGTVNGSVPVNGVDTAVNGAAGVAVNGVDTAVVAVVSVGKLCEELLS